MKYTYQKKYPGVDGDQHWSGWVETWDCQVILTSPSLAKFQGRPISEVQLDMNRRAAKCLLVEENADPRK